MRFELDGKEFFVVPASFTDEDVERVAEAIYVLFQEDAPDFAEAHNEWKEDSLNLARAALSAYLEPTTKKET